MNSERRWKRGDIGPDGRVFLKYDKCRNDAERWVAVDDLNKIKASEEARRQTPEYKAKAKARNASINKTPEQKASEEARRQTSEYKAKNNIRNKNRRQTPEYKEYRKAYRQNPGYKAYMKKYAQTPEAKSRDRSRKQARQKTESARRYMTAILAVQSISALKQQPETEP